MKTKKLSRKKPAAKKTAKKPAKKKVSAARRATKKVAKKAVRRKPAPRKAATQRQKVVAAMTEAATSLTVKEALDIALDFERKVRDHYAKGSDRIVDPQGKKVFAALAKEEQGHVDYLESHLAKLAATGTVGDHKLTSILPAPGWVREAEVRHRQTAMIRRIAGEDELGLLKEAVKLENDASGFYHDLVRRLPEGDRPLFEQFLNIEDGHLAIVQSELDAVQGMGYWFDVPEFALEAQ